MPRLRVTNRWFLVAFAGGVVLVVVTSGRGWWWIQNDRRASLLEQSRAAYNRQDWATARTKAIRPLKTHRDDPVALRLLGRTLYRLQRDQDATAIFARLTPDTMEAEDYLVRSQNLESAPRMSNPRSKTSKRPCSLTRTTLSRGSRSSRFST